MRIRVHIPPLLGYVFAVAVLLRLVFLFNPGFEADISFWKSWGLATYDKGIVEGLKVTNNNYPTPFAYLLGGMVGVYSLVADPHNFNEFWSNTNYLFLAIAKSVPVFADFGIALLLLYVGRRAKKLGFPEFRQTILGLSPYEFLAAIYLLNPVSVIDGAWWGQMDSLGLLLFLISTVLALSKKPFLAGLVYMVSMMTKLQNMIYGPVFFLLLWQSMGYTGLIRAAIGALVGFVGLNIEFLLSRNTDMVIRSLTENYDYFPWMSLNAYNLWWIVAQGVGMRTSDKLLTVGLVNAKTTGLLLFSGFYLFAVLRQFLNDRRVWPRDIEDRRLIPVFLESLIIVNAAFFLFQTQSHERYAFPLFGFLLFWAPFILHETGNGKRMALRSANFLFFSGYGFLSFYYFLNLHAAFATNYPQNTLPFLGFLTWYPVPLGISYIQLLFFGLFLMMILRTAGLSRVLLVLSAAIVGGGLFALNLPLITKQPVSLTRFTPFISQQDYGSRQKDKSVQSSFGGPNAATRLSSQYVFYRHGFGTHAYSKNAFDIGAYFRTFTTDYGIDTEAGTKGSAVFEIYGDGKLLFRSDTQKRFDLPRHVSVPITGVRILTLVTTDAGDGNYDDHTDWLNPVLLP